MDPRPLRFRTEVERTMSEITRYVLVDSDDNELNFQYETFEDALVQAERMGCAIVEWTYVYDDSSLVWTPNGDNSWPPISEDAEAGGHA